MSRATPKSQHRCTCGEMLVDELRQDGTIGRVCRVCVPVKLVDVVRQLFVRRDAA